MGSANEERLNAPERAFLAASIEQEEHDALEREAQRQRELEAAQKLAEHRSIARQNSYAAVRYLPLRRDTDYHNHRHLDQRALWLSGNTNFHAF